MNQKLRDYIEQHKACSDLIFRNWHGFLDVLFSCGGSVREILWFEYVPVSMQAQSLGHGGYADAENVAYMWAETLLHDKNLEHMDLVELSEHIDCTIRKHLPHILVPCFFDITA